MTDGMALSDLRVVDAGQVIAGPICATYLADLGADVIKLESPGGDIARSPRGEMNGVPVSPTFELINRNKRSLSVDLKTDEGREVVYDLVEGADVFVQNWPPGVAERLGVDYGTLREHNEELVYVHVSGYGEWGPAADQPAMDAAIQHVSGLSSLQGYDGHPPIRAQSSLGDFYAGTNAAVAALAAVRHRDAGGGGQHVEISMLESAMHNMDSAFEFHLNLGDEFERGGKNSFLNPESLYGAAETEDGYVCVAFYLNSDRVWEGFCELVDRPDLLADPTYEDSSARADEAGRFSEMLEDLIRGWTSEEALEKLSEVGIPAAPHNTVAEAAAMDHVEERDVFTEVDHPLFGSFTITNTPFRLSETPGSIRTHAPLLGEHTAAVLRELGYDEERVEGLADEGIVSTEDE